jgi:putative peptidoglycan lipid II flippase
MTAASTLVPHRQSDSVNLRILRAAGSVAIVGLVVKSVATFKEIAVAGVFGRSDAMDAFAAAALIPSLLVNLLSESMSQALVPTLIRVREREGLESAQRLLSSSMLWLCLMLFAASLAMAATARGFFPWIASRFDPAKLDLSIRLFRAMLPAVLATGLATNCAAVLNTLERFSLPALAPVATPIAMIAGALLLSGRMGIWSLVCATLAGSILHAVAAAGMMEAHGYRLRLRWQRMTEPMREVAWQYGAAFLGGAVSSGGLLVDQSMAAMLPTGSVSALVYANRFVSVALNLMAGAVSAAVTPYFSKMIAFRDWTGCRHSLRTWTVFTAAVSAPVAVALIAGSHPLIRIALQHGAFGPQDTEAVSPVLAMYAIQIPFFVVSRVFYRFLVALRRTDLILDCGAINLGLDIVLNLLLMRWMGVAGIALATSLWTVSTFLFLLFWARKLLHRKSLEETQDGSEPIS